MGPVSDVTGETRRGILMGLGAYGMWGVFPLYWPLLRPATALEILAHRIVWSLVFVGALLAFGGGLRALRRLDKAQVGTLAIAALTLSINWLTYIWAVNSGHVVETALGYFINPLVTIALGVGLLGERLRSAQRLAIGLATVAVVVIAIDYGRLPWIALSLAVTFAAYGFLKKRAAVAAVPAMAVETGVLFAPALFYLVMLEGRTIGTFGHVSHGTDSLLLATGVVTAVPLLCFAGAANRVPLTALGLLQYVTPVLQLLCGVVVYRESMAPSRWAGFVLVWIALVVLAIDGVRARAPEPAT